MRAGVGDVILLHVKTPQDVLEYYRDEANSMVGYGVRTSFLENLRLIPDIAAQWLVVWNEKKLQKKSTWVLRA